MLPLAGEIDYTATSVTDNSFFFLVTDDDMDKS
jgi:hypothetical protein